MTERSIVAKLRAEIGDYKAKMQEAAGLTKKVGEAAEQTSKRSRVSFDSMAKSVQANEASISKVSNAALGIGAGLAVGVGGVVKTFADFDKQMSGVAATGSDAKANIDALRDSAIKLGADSAFSATEAAAGVENLLKAGVSAADVMGGGLKGSLDLAAAGSLEVGDAAEIAATALTQFKLQGKDVPRVADLLAAGAGKAQGEVSDLAGALNQSGLVASQFGLSIEETTGTLSAFASAGLLGSDAGTSFKTMLLALANPSKESADLMEELGINAYDVAGNFVGVADLADQLKNNLGGLTQASRDQALAQIFGNDAVRAANVLFSQGSAGIKDWTSKVDDAGFAAETAETKLDNLAGDFEKLQGAVEGAFLKSGSGANDALRGLTQRGTDLAEAIGKIPGPALEAGVGVAAVGGAGLLAVGGIGKLVVGIADTREAFNNLAPAGGRARGAIAGVGKAAGVAAVGLAALQIAGNIIDDLDKKGVPSLDQTSAALLRVAGSGDTAADGLDTFFMVSNAGSDFYGDAPVNNMADAFDRLLNKTSGQKVQDWGASVVDGLGGPSGVSAQLSERFAQVDASLTSLVGSGKADEAAASFTKLAQAAKDQGASVDELLALFPQYRDSLVSQANELGVTTLSAEDYAGWMGGKIPEAIGRATAASGGVTDAMGATKEATVDLRKAQEKLAEETKKVTDNFTILRDGFLDSDAATANFEASIDALSESVKTNGKSLDVNTEKGRANRSAVRDNISALNDKITADFKANVESKGLAKATDIASEALKTGRGRMLDSAAAAGYSKGEVKKMQDRMLLTPKELRTQVNTPGLQGALTGVASLKTAISNITGKTVTINFDTNASYKSSAGNKFAVNLTAPSGVGRRADGGTIYGVGGPREDNVAGIDARSGVQTSWVSVGEEVINYRAAEANRAALKAINAGNGKQFEVHPVGAHADGGTVGRAVNTRVNANLDPLARSMTDTAAGVTRWAVQEAQRIGKVITDKIAESTAAAGGVQPIDMSNPRGLTSFRGHRFSNLFAANLLAAERASGQQFSIYQGGFRPATSYSGTSHQGDAIDARVNFALLNAARARGIPMWDRTGKGNWVSHMHGIPLPGAGYPGGSAVWQGQDYKRGGDGLYTGTQSATAGWHWVGEKGPELRHFRGGETVLSAAKSGAAVSAARVQMRPAQTGYTAAQVASAAAAGAPAIDNQALQAAVAAGARQGIEQHLQTLDSRQAVALVRSANQHINTRGGGR